ncbi:MAG: hypothetical protein COA49_01740 [Bacteroidetes bacterium]|nr:MAG: hypothetical protein COA49_01740 [Bacteroidota bacterium]
MNITFKSLLPLFLLSIIIISPFSSFSAQTSLSSQLTSKFTALRTAVNDVEREIAHRDLKIFVRNILTDFDSSEMLFDLFENWPAGIASAGKGDELVTVISWNYERQDRTEDYGGFVIYGFEGADLYDSFKWTELVHNRNEDPTDESRSYRVDDWPGAIYYELVLTHDGKTPIYTLLGWDGANAQVTRKIMETMIITNDRVRIGVPYLNRPDGIRKRHVLEYSDALQATLRYDAENGRIVFDKLAPSDPSLAGATAFYGPTLEYDAYVWTKGKWELLQNVDVNNSRDKERHRPYNDPRESN